jgi:hypothetical protein
VCGFFFFLNNWSVRLSILYLLKPTSDSILQKNYQKISTARTLKPSLCFSRAGLYLLNTVPLRILNSFTYIKLQILHPLQNGPLKYRLAIARTICKLNRMHINESI